MVYQRQWHVHQHRLSSEWLCTGSIRNAVMETGHDILGNSLVPAIMLGQRLMGQVPFKHVYLLPGWCWTSMAKNEQIKRQMLLILSRRWVSMARCATPRTGGCPSCGARSAFSTTKVVGPQLCNKLRNIARFIEDKLGDTYAMQEAALVTLADHWVRWTWPSSRPHRIIIRWVSLCGKHPKWYTTLFGVVADWYISQ